MSDRRSWVMAWNAGSSRHATEEEALTAADEAQPDRQPATARLRRARLPPPHQEEGQPMSDCRYVTGQGYFKRSHLPVCRDRDCRGCEPCEQDDQGRPIRHCTARRTCSGHLQPGEITCARCVGKTRTTIRACVDLAALMPEEAEEQGVESEAAYLAGPAAHPAAWSERRIAMRSHLATWTKTGRITDEQHLHARAAMEDDDEHHPYAVLTRWALVIAEDTGHTLPEPLTVVGAAGYLEGQLTRLAQDPDQDWKTFTDELGACQTHMEAVLHNSRAPERGAPCPECSTRDEPGPALVKRYASRVTRIDGELTVIGDITGASDRWYCPRVREHEWSEADYRLRIGDEHLEHADDLTIRDLAIRTGVAAGTIRRWANVTRRVTTDGVVEVPARLRPSGRSHDGRKLYRVADVEALRDGTTDQEEAS